MNRILISVFFVLFGPSLCRSQTYWIPKTQFLDFLFQNKTAEINVARPNIHTSYLPLLDPHLKNYNQKIIKNKKGLFILLDGTGQVYKATADNKDYIVFTRQDSTYFIGYNGDNYNFSYYDTIYSLGGTGFWRVNGQLRYFSESIAEWNIYKLDHEFPLIDYFVNYLPSKSLLYYVEQPISDGATYNKIEDYSIIRLNLANKTNFKIGTLNNKFIKLCNQLSYPTHYVNLETLNGILVFFNSEEQYLMDFSKNKAYKLINPKIKDLFYRKSSGNIPIQCFEFEQRLYFQFPDDSTQQLRNIPISKADFSNDSIEIYKEANQDFSFFQLGLISLIIISVLSFLIYKYIKRRNQKSEELTPLSTIDFNEQEKQLINFILDRTKNNLMVSVEELNFALGISKKTLEIQKRTRTETIHKINHKFRLIFEKEVDFIERVRAEDDKRYYNYTIQNENASLFKSKYKK